MTTKKRKAPGKSGLSGKTNGRHDLWSADRIVTEHTRGSANMKER